MTPPVEVSAENNYLNQEVGFRSWLLTLDHKRIGLLYVASVTFFFALGTFALLMRLSLLEPTGWLVGPETYKSYLPWTESRWWVLPDTFDPNTLGHFFIPLMIGANDVAFPKLNLLSWYIFMLGGTVTLFSMIRGGVDTGWTFYTPFITTYSTTYVTAAAIGILIAGFSSILTGLNFIATIHRMRAPGITWFRLPILFGRIMPPALFWCSRPPSWRSP